MDGQENHTTETDYPYHKKVVSHQGIDFYPPVHEVNWFGTHNWTRAAGNRCCNSFRELDPQQMHYVLHAVVYATIRNEPDLLNLREVTTFLILQVALMMKLSPRLIMTESIPW